MAKATALSHRQLIRERLRGLRWILWLREAQLEAAWEQHAKALLAWSFQEVWVLQAGAQEGGGNGSSTSERKPFLLKGATCWAQVAAHD